MQMQEVWKGNITAGAYGTRNLKQHLKVCPRKDNGCWAAYTWPKCNVCKFT